MSMMQLRFSFVALLFLAPTVLGQFPPPKSLGPVEKYGANLQRSMTLMATSTGLKRNTVRILFYNHGHTEAFEQIIRGFRERTTADILIATDHVAPLLGERMDEEINPEKLKLPKPGTEPDAAWRSYIFLPATAKKYGAELADV